MCVPNENGPKPQAVSPLYSSLKVEDQRAEVARIQATMSPQEMEIAKYHRKSIETGNVGREKDGSPITVYSNTIQIQEGPHKGKFATVPGWFDGKKHDDEDKVYNKWKGEIDKGKWPIYSDPKEADNRAKFIHGIMDAEGDGKKGRK